MAPSTMFSYLRPGHAKRSASANAATLASPEQPAPVASPALTSPAAGPPRSPSHAPDYLLSPHPPVQHAAVSSGPSISPFAPRLPPIVRVASTLDRSEDRPLFSPPQSADGRLSPSHERPKTAGPPSSAALSQSSMLSPDSTTLSPSYAAFSRSQTSLINGISEKLSSSSKGSPAPTPAPANRKSRLSLRNPMSLLTRRRSGQMLDPLLDESLVTRRSPSLLPPMPDNYDPSIRGHIVHDFNAPRPNRNFSHNNAYGAQQGQQDRGRVSPPKIDKEHTPVFREHFDDDTSYEQSQANIRAEQLANKDFIARNSVQMLPTDPSPSPPPPPPVPKDSPTLPPPMPTAPPPPPPPLLLNTQIPDHNPSVLAPVQESPSPTEAPAEATPKKRKSTKTPPSSRSRATSIHDPSFQSAGLPAHFTSRASRFSFQISGGSDSAQEKLLEDRHKQKEAEKASKKQVRISTNTLDDAYDEYDMEDFDMDDGYEEDIPMLGEADDFGGLGDQEMGQNASAFDFSDLSTQPVDGAPFGPVAHMQTSINANGDRIEFAMSGDALRLDGACAQGEEAGNEGLKGLGLVGLPSEQNQLGNPSALPEMTSEDTETPEDGYLDDDMYFDDGLIGEQDEMGASEFDENVFDDPDGPLYERRVRTPPLPELPNPLNAHPIRVSSLYLTEDEINDMSELPDPSQPLPARVSSLVFSDEAGSAVSGSPNPSETHPVRVSSLVMGEEAGKSIAELLSSSNAYPVRDSSLVLGEEDSNIVANQLEKSEPSLIHKVSTTQPRTVASFGGMEAYHSALADAANRAEAAGRFARKNSVDVGTSSPDVEDNPTRTDSRPSLIPDDGRGSLETDYFSPDDDGFGVGSGFVDDYDYSDFESGLEDDPMIAAANAEALAYDDEGFYGQEFGFYASAVGDSPNTWGGFFGPSGLNRSISGRNAVREPNLTPITERSEYSTRNSFISLSHFRDAQQPLHSPGLAQLRMSPYGWPEDEDINLDSLMKLRKGAFGSNAPSLPGSTSNSPRNSSPMGMQFVPRTASPAGNRMKEQSDSDVDSNASASLNNDDDFDDGDRQEDDLIDAMNDAVNAAYEDDPDDDFSDLSSPLTNPPPTNGRPSSSPANIYKDLPPLPGGTHNITSAFSSPTLPPANFATFPTLPTQATLPGAAAPAQTAQSPLHTYTHRKSAPASTLLSLITPPTTSHASTAPRRKSTPLVTPISPITSASPSTPGRRQGHSRSGSQADSVAYVREKNEAGEGRWVLERRRTAESGELELVGREVVEGGRI